MLCEALDERGGGLAVAGGALVHPLLGDDPQPLDQLVEELQRTAVADIRKFIGMVLDNGHAYEAGGAVYFDVSTFDDFGTVSGYDRETMLEYAAERGGNPDDPNKRDPLDFILWQPSAPDEPVTTLGLMPPLYLDEVASAIPLLLLLLPPFPASDALYWAYVLWLEEEATSAAALRLRCCSCCCCCCCCCC